MYGYDHLEMGLGGLGMNPVWSVPLILLILLFRNFSEVVEFIEAGGNDGMVGAGNFSQPLSCEARMECNGIRDFLACASTRLPGFRYRSIQATR